MLGPSQAKSVRLANNLGRLRMILELKRDERRKARLILQGFREPAEWDEGSVASRVAYPSSIRTFLFHSGPRSDVITTNDVSVAFLQSDPYSDDQDPRRELDSSWVRALQCVLRSGSHRVVSPEAKIQRQAIPLLLIEVDL